MFFRKMNMPAVEQALKRGLITMNAGERKFGGLVGVGYRPRISPYFFQYQIPNSVNIRTIDGSPFKVDYFSTIKSPATSKRTVLEGVDQLPLSGGTLFKRVNGKYEQVLDPS